MSEQPDDQFEAEAVDEDVVDGQSFPPDRPLGVADALARDTMVPGEEVLDSLADRIAREEPDVAPVPNGDLELRDGIIEDDVDELEGELGEADDDDLVLSDSVGAGRDERSAEELALHIESDPEDETLTEILEEHEQRRP
jgi:hypothetical protein